MSSTSSALILAFGLPEAARHISATRPEVFQHLEEAYTALYEVEQVLPARVLHSIAAIVARRQGNAQLAEHHIALGDESLTGEALPRDVKLKALIEHVDLITVSPALVIRDDQLTLELAGVTPDEIVLVSQVVAFTSTAVRVHHALTLLADETPRVAEPLARQTVAHGREVAPPSHTARGRVIPTEFTRDVLAWEPWVIAPSADQLTAEQTASFASKASANSEYFRLLSRVPAALRARSELDNAIFIGRDGLPRGERELAAAVTSKVNDCVYCASVHARKAEFQTKRTEDIDRLLAVRLDRDADWLAADVAPLAAGQDARWEALILFSARLAELVPSATTADVQRLKDQGLNAEEIVDAALATAFFSWANRLMLSLGEPAVPEAA